MEQVMNVCLRNETRPVLETLGPQIGAGTHSEPSTKG